MRFLFIYNEYVIYVDNEICRVIRSVTIIIYIPGILVPEASIAKTAEP